jgi:peptidoglycan/LPS O-acetylase OafA/YrhL
MPEEATDKDAISIAPQHYPALDGLRGLAVLMVFIFHYGGGLKSHLVPVRLVGILTEAGWVGVMVFFALSGFLITGHFFDSRGEPHRLRNFYMRRILRIFPLYFLVLLISTVASLQHGYPWPLMKPLGYYALFLQDLPNLAILSMYYPSPLPIYHLWSIAVEEQFYLFWPLLMLLVRTRRAALGLALWIFTFSAIFRLVVYGLPSLAVYRYTQVFDKFLFTHAGGLALGCAAALAIRSSKAGRKSTSSRTINRWATGAFFLGLAVFLYSSFLSKSFYLASPIQFIVGLPGICLAAAAAIPILIRVGPARNILSASPLRALGRVSYGFYVFHIFLQPLFDLIGTAITHTTSGDMYQLVRLLAAFPISLLAAWLSYHFLERPFLRLKRHFPLGVITTVPRNATTSF